MKQIFGILLIPLGIAVAAAAAGGCTRTSDGSYVMRRPAMFTSALGPRSTRPDVIQLEAGPAVYADQPPPQPVATSARRKVPSISMPSMSIAKNPPFKRADPDKPLSCHNETTPTGRIRVVCI